MNATRSQCEAILRHLETKGPITPLEALDLYGSFRLGARILNLKERGHDIQTEMVSANGKRFARYSLVQPKGQIDLFRPAGSPATTAPSRAATGAARPGTDHAGAF